MRSTVNLTVAGLSYTQPLVVKMDPQLQVNDELKFIVDISLKFVKPRRNISTSR
jgi:hypothetical protein